MSTGVFCTRFSEAGRISLESRLFALSSCFLTAVSWAVAPSSSSSDLRALRPWRRRDRAVGASTACVWLVLHLSRERRCRCFGRSCPRSAVSFLPRLPGARVQGRLGVAGDATPRGDAEDNDGCAVWTVRVVLRSQSVG